MRIGCLQFAPQVGDIDNNLNRAVRISLYSVATFRPRFLRDRLFGNSSCPPETCCCILRSVSGKCRAAFTWAMLSSGAVLGIAITAYAMCQNPLTREITGCGSRKGKSG